ncbi:hypothetical protein ACVWZ4_003881 [Bradyrhizobium sp. USDA 4472]
MQSATDHDGEGTSVALSLEEEVAAWRNRRGLRQGATTGRIQVVRISKRVLIRSREPFQRVLRPRP